MRNKKIKINIETYEGLGLIEAVVAILVVGALAIVFLTFATHSVMELARMEQYDLLTVESQKASQMVRAIAEKQNSTEDPTLFPPVNSSAIKGTCYFLQGDISNASFSAADSGWVADCNVNISNPGDMQSCRDKADQTEDVYAVYCVDEYSPEENLVKGKILTGLTKCPTRINSNECKVSSHSITIFNKLEVAN